MGSITFVNASAFEASIYSLDGAGNATFVADVAPSASSTQNTVAGQVWVVKDKGTGREVGRVTGTDGAQTYEIKFGRGRGEPTQGGGG